MENAGRYPWLHVILLDKYYIYPIGQGWLAPGSRRKTSFKVEVMVVCNNEIRTHTMQTGHLSTLLASQYLSLSQSTCAGHIKLHRGVKFNYSNVE